MKEEKLNLGKSNTIKSKKDDITLNVNLDTTKAMESVKKLKDNLDSIKPISLGDFAAIEQPPQIVYNYYNCSFNYGDHGYARNENKEPIKDDSGTTN